MRARKRGASLFPYVQAFTSSHLSRHKKSSKKLESYSRPSLIASTKIKWVQALSGDALVPTRTLRRACCACTLLGFSDQTLHISNRLSDPDLCGLPYVSGRESYHLRILAGVSRVGSVPHRSCTQYLLTAGYDLADLDTLYVR